mgnify:CR=1 FL=1
MEGLIDNALDTYLPEIYDLGASEYPLQLLAGQIHVALLLFYEILRLGWELLPNFQILIRVEKVFDIIGLSAILTDRLKNEKIIFLRRQSHFG